MPAPAWPARRVEERGALCLPFTERDDLFELVDDHDTAWTEPGDLLERDHRMRSGSHHHHAAPAAPEAGGDPGANQGGLAAPGGSHHRHDVLASQDVQAGGDLGVPAEEPLSVVDVVGQQAAIRALEGGLPGDRDREKPGVLVQDRLLQGSQLGARIQTELTGKHRTRALQRRQCLPLATRLVLRPGQQRPAVLPIGLVGDQPAGVGEHLPPVTGGEGGLDSQLLGVATQLLPSFRRRLRGRPPRQVGECRSVP